MPAILIAILMTLCTQAVSSEYERNANRWSEFVSINKWGQSNDFWLEKSTAYGWEKVVLVFGYWNDNEACIDVKLALETKWPAASYRCLPANTN